MADRTQLKELKSGLATVRGNTSSKRKRSVAVPAEVDLAGEDGEINEEMDGEQPVTRRPKRSGGGKRKRTARGKK